MGNSTSWFLERQVVNWTSGFKKKTFEISQIELNPIDKTEKESPHVD
jgi:hypothetical protein